MTHQFPWPKWTVLQIMNCVGSLELVAILLSKSSVMEGSVQTIKDLEVLVSWIVDSRVVCVAIVRVLL